MTEIKPEMLNEMRETLNIKFLNFLINLLLIFFKFIKNICKFRKKWETNLCLKQEIVL